MARHLERMSEASHSQSQSHHSHSDKSNIEELMEAEAAAQAAIMGMEVSGSEKGVLGDG